MHTHTHTPFFFKCLSPSASHWLTWKVAQSRVTDQAYDKQADWGGREAELQRPAAVHVSLALCAFAPQSSECSRKSDADLCLFFFQVLHK